jgi:hypothetical protein
MEEVLKLIKIINSKYPLIHQDITLKEGVVLIIGPRDQYGFRTVPRGCTPYDYECIDYCGLRFAPKFGFDYDFIQFKLEEYILTHM